MILAENIIQDGKKIKKSRTIPISFVQYLLERASKKSILGPIGEGLSDKDVKMIKDLHNNGELKDHAIRIYKTTAFGHFMFIGALITILSKGNFLIYLYLLF